MKKVLVLFILVIIISCKTNNDIKLEIVNYENKEVNNLIDKNILIKKEIGKDSGNINIKFEKKAIDYILKLEETKFYPYSINLMINSNYSSGGNIKIIFLYGDRVIMSESLPPGEFSITKTLDYYGWESEIKIIFNDVRDGFINLKYKMDH
jgi:hypothetical protein